MRIINLPRFISGITAIVIGISLTIVCLILDRTNLIVLEIFPILTGINSLFNSIETKKQRVAKTERLKNLAKMYCLDIDFNKFKEEKMKKVFCDKCGKEITTDAEWVFNHELCPECAKAVDVFITHPSRLSTLDIQPIRHGRWIITDDVEHFIAVCSECGRAEDSRGIKDMPYCHCGARMDLKDGDAK